MREAARRQRHPRATRILLVSAIGLVVAGVAAVPPGILAARRGERAAAEAFRGRAEVLTRSLASVAAGQVALRAEGYATIRDLTAARRSMPEATSVTITGPHQDEIYNSERCSVRDYVLASDEEAWQSVRESGAFRPAEESAGDELGRKGVIGDFQREVEERLRAALGDRVNRYAEGRAALNAARAGPRGRIPPQLSEARQALFALGREIDQALSAEVEALGPVRSYPAFDPAQRAGSYVFYSPIVFFDPSVSYFCNGMVRVAVETSSLELAMQDARRRAGSTAVGFGLLAFGVGAAAAGLTATRWGSGAAPRRQGGGASSPVRRKGGKARG